MLISDRGDPILARVNRAGYKEIGRAPVIELTHLGWGRVLVWSDPAFRLPGHAQVVPKREKTMLARITLVLFIAVSAGIPRIAGGGDNLKPNQVKVAAVQVLGYDKTDVPRPDFDPTEPVVRYIEKAAGDGVQLVVFPEYVLGRISVPGPETARIAKAAAGKAIYVIVGCWEVYDDRSFANTALLFDRSGKIIGKYRKVHAAVDRFEGQPPWSQPPKGKDTDWFIQNDPEWIMQRGDGFPVFETDFGKIGILTCYDGWFPETFRMLSLNGAEILIWINGRRGGVEDFIVKSAMFRNEVAMITSNQAYGAGAMIGQWPSEILAHNAEAKECYITATINLQRVRRARQFSRNSQQRRPELYGEIVRPLAKVQPAGGAEE